MSLSSEAKESVVRWVAVRDQCETQDFASKLKISSDSLKKNLFNDVILVPTHEGLYEDLPQFNLFPSYTKLLMCLLKEHELSASLYDDGKEKRELVLRSVDIKIPILVFTKDVVVPVALGVLSNWIFAHFANRRKEPTIKIEYAVLESAQQITRWRRLEGPAAAVVRLLKEEILWAQGKSIKKPILLNLKNNQNSYKAHRAKAKEAMREARKLRERADKCFQLGDKAQAEQLFRATLAKIREAVLWEPTNESYRKHLHATGRNIHDCFGCIIKFEEGAYQIDCPVMLSHSKGGFSIGAATKVLCSICGGNFLDCDHVPGSHYPAIATRMMGVCNICGADKCSHIEGQIYDGAQMTGIVTDMSLDHVAYVDRPADPLCCVHKYSMSRSDVLNELPEEEKTSFIYGQTLLHCHHCVTCKGMRATKLSGTTASVRIL